MARRKTVREESRREVGTLDMAYSTLPCSSFFLFPCVPSFCDDKRAEMWGRPRHGFYSLAAWGWCVRSGSSRASSPHPGGRARRAVWPGRDRPPARLPGWLEPRRCCARCVAFLWGKGRKPGARRGRGERKKGTNRPGRCGCGWVRFRL